MAESIVVLGFLSAVAVIEFVGGNGVPESVGLLASAVFFSDVTSSEVGFEDGFAEVDPAEIVAMVPSFEIEALVITVVPGDVGKGSSGLDEALLGSVPVVMRSEETGRNCGEECEQNNKNLAHQYDMFIISKKQGCISTYLPVSTLTIT